MKVKVYYNLTKKVFSIKSVETGLVTGHAEAVHLGNATFKVQPGGRDRVRREHKKYVHAFVIGDLLYSGGDYIRVDGKVSGLPPCKQAKYNPYVNDTFVDSETGESVDSASIVILQGKKVYYN